MNNKALESQRVTTPQPCLCSYFFDGFCHHPKARYGLRPFPYCPLSPPLAEALVTGADTNLTLAIGQDRVVPSVFSHPALTIDSQPPSSHSSSLAIGAPVETASPPEPRYDISFAQRLQGELMKEFYGKGD